MLQAPMMYHIIQIRTPPIISVSVYITHQLIYHFIEHSIGIIYELHISCCMLCFNLHIRLDKLILSMLYYIN